MTQKIGVFICECANNISEIVDVGQLLETVKEFDGVIETKIHRLWCSEEAREELKKIIKEKQLSRVVIAACSPKEHEITFQKVLAQAGLNPYLLQIVNIREQIAWVTRDRHKATQKAISQLIAAINRVKLHEPLEKSQIDCKSDFLVIGAGVAGIAAALTLAKQKNRKVYLVEKEPWIGGKAVAYEDVFPNMECAPCMLEPEMDEVLHNERIVLLTNSEIENLKGFYGNFQVQIKNKARLIDAEKCLGCAACYEVCPVKVKNKFNGNLSERHAVYSAFPGVLPNLPVIDKENCLRFKGQNCNKCQEACPLLAVDYEQKDKTLNIDVGAIVVATGFGLTNITDIKNFSIGDPNVLDAFQFERLISSTGPTEGKIVTSNNFAPESIAFIHCAGSRDKLYKEYCSGVCCAYSLKLAHLAKKKLEHVLTYEIYSDWCLPGKSYQEFYNKVCTEGTEYIRADNPNNISISSQDKKIAVNTKDKSIMVDMVVIAPAMIPHEESSKLAALLGMPLDKNGFYAAGHDKLSASSTTARGIYIAGCATGPKDITQSVLQAQAAAGLALSVIVPGEKLDLEVFTSIVNEKLCGGCHTCIPLCPYQAIKFDTEKKVAVINEILCQGCGVCTSACPAGAITSKHFSDQEIAAEIEGVLQ